MVKPDNNKEKKKITDSRFAAASYDPRFRSPKLGRMKVKLDDRFSREQVEDSRKKFVSVDKYGRNVKKLAYLQKDRFGGDDFDKYFEKEDEDENSEHSEDKDEDENKNKDDVSSSEEDSEPSSDSEDKEEDKVVVQLDRARGEGISDEESSSESDSDSDSSSDEDDVQSEEELAIEEEKPEIGDATSRLALVNMDWDNIKAVDILATLASFCKNSSASTRSNNETGIKSVTIYPSEFGKMKMAKEETEGPSRELFTDKKKKNKQDDSSDSDSESIDDIDLKSKYDYQDNQQRAIKALYEDNQDGGNEEDYNSKSLRKYQLQRLRYYYAIIVCDSVSTAENIYQNCDGLEFEATANFFDLRYVPDDTEFPEYVPGEIDSDIHDYCDSIPVNYKPKIDYQTSALQHSKVKLTWDETPSDRMKFASKAFSSKDIEEMDFKAYLASDSDEEEKENGNNKEENSLKDKYKSLLKSSIEIGDRNIFDNKSDDDSDADMEITFTPGISNNADSAEEVEKEESSIDKYKRKAKERRKQRKEQIKESKKNSSTNNVDKGKRDDIVDKDLKKIVDSRKDDEKEQQHFDLKQIMKQEKESKKKRKNKSKKNIDDEYLQEGFTPNLEDERFKGIFDDQAFNIDPNMPEFKKTSTMMKILEERNKRLESSENNESSGKKSNKKRKHNDDDSYASNNSSANKLAEKIKSKYKKTKKNKI